MKHPIENSQSIPRGALQNILGAYQERTEELLRKMALENLPREAPKEASQRFYENLRSTPKMTFQTFKILLKMDIIGHFRYSLLEGIADCRVHFRF